MGVHSMGEYDKEMPQAHTLCQPWYREEETQNTNQSLPAQVIPRTNYKPIQTLVNLLTPDTMGLCEVLQHLVH